MVATISLRDELLDAWRGEGNSKRVPFRQWLKDMAENPRGVLRQAARMYLNPVPKLTGQALADALALTYRHYVDPKRPGSKVWCTDLRNGWIELRGVFLKVHPDLVDQHPNGWEMLDRVRYADARERIRHAARD